MAKPSCQPVLPTRSASPRLAHHDPRGDVRRGSRQAAPRTIRGFANAVRGGSYTAVDAIGHSLSRIDERADLNAFTYVDRSGALEEARRADRALAAGRDLGPLQGVPISVKDLIDMAGVRTSASSLVTEGTIADHDAVVVQRLRDRGAVLIGKTNLHEFAYGTTNEDSSFGPARNPWDPSRSPGGSSGGSAISVAAGMVFGSIGTDTGGSVRIPAAACGVVGLKPSYGELPTTGVIPLAPSLDHVGVLAGTVNDAFLIYNALKGAAGGRLVEASLVGVRVGVLHAFFCDLLDEEVARAFEATLGVFSAKRAVCVERQMPGTELIEPTFVHLQAPEAYAFHAATLRKSPELYTPAVRARLERGATIPASLYVEARRVREQLTASVEQLLEDVDVLALPTLPIPAPRIGAEQVGIGGHLEPVRGLMLKMTRLFNITGHPAISIPCGRTATGLPCGLQLVAARNRTVRLLEISRGCEKALASSEGRR